MAVTSAIPPPRGRSPAVLRPVARSRVALAHAGRMPPQRSAPLPLVRAPAPATPPSVPSAAAPVASADAAALLALGDWRGLIRALGLGGLGRELAQHCEWVECGDGVLQLRLSTAHRHLLDMNRGAVERLQDLLGAALGRTLAVRIAIGDIAGETPAQRDAIERRPATPRRWRRSRPTPSCAS